VVGERERAILRLTSEVLGAARDFLRREGFVELIPVILAPVTDPLRHTTDRVVIEAYGINWHLTRSMIFHKQAAIRVCERIFSFSPNVRLESGEWAKTGRHLFEFVQLDLEWRGANRDEVMNLGERLLVHVVDQVQGNCAWELGLLGRRLPGLHPPFPCVPYREAKARYGEGFEGHLSTQAEEPVWIVDFPIEAREFYDREDPDRPGLLLDMDLIYPEGYGEALSGGEREREPLALRRRIRAQGLEVEAYAPLLALAEEGIPPSAGFGIGVERLVRFLGGLAHIRETRLFPRVPGELPAL
jgi:asparaginyl-tRNA synthetase